MLFPLRKCESLHTLNTFDVFPSSLPIFTAFRYEQIRLSVVRRGSCLLQEDVSNLANIRGCYKIATRS